MFQLLSGLQKLRRTIPDPPTRVRGSLALRAVDVGSCNGCEHELTATLNPYYDLSQYGLSIVASPRHADLLLVTGTVTVRMEQALRTAYEAMPEPRMVAAVGSCALGVNVLGNDPEFATPLAKLLPINLTIPGCPPSPAAIINALTNYLSDPRG